MATATRPPLLAARNHVLPAEIDLLRRNAIALVEPGWTLLYHLWNGTATPAYIGITRNPIERWRQHRQQKSWWNEIELITWQGYPKEHVALAAERAAIRAERPIYNRRSAVSD